MTYPVYYFSDRWIENFKIGKLKLQFLILYWSRLDNTYYIYKCLQFSETFRTLSFIFLVPSPTSFPLRGIQLNQHVCYISLIYFLKYDYFIEYI